VETIKIKFQSLSTDNNYKCQLRLFANLPPAEQVNRTMMRKQILFVDDSPKILDDLRHMLRNQQDEWDLYFAGSGNEALGLLNKKNIDVVVSDMFMPGMDGIHLLKEIRSRFPHIVRIALSGQMDEAMILQASRVVHQFLAKPCDAELLKVTIHRTCRLRDILSNPRLRQLVSELETIPSLPSLYLEISNELESEDASMEKISHIIGRDVGMTTKILQLVNSAFFGLNRRITSLSQAVKLLGLNTIKSLVLSVQVFGQFSSEAVKRFSLDTLMKHSLSTGLVAAAIAKEETMKLQIAEDAFLGGMLHDLGKLILAHNLPQCYELVLDTAKGGDITFYQAEQESYGVTHADIGASLMLLWGMDDSIVEAVALHHDPSLCIAKTFCPLTAVYAANIFEQAHRQQLTETVPDDPHPAHMENLKLRQHWTQWWNLSKQMLKNDQKP
jgi:HD-like signal output (HDOD) protein